MLTIGQSDLEINIAFTIPFKEDNNDYYLKTFPGCLFIF